MLERTHKRKRSLQDSTIDVSKMKMALNRLEVLKAELGGIKETEEELQSISEHVLALESILKGAKKPRVTFSTVMRRRLAFEHTKITTLTKDLTEDAEAEIADLYSRIKKIYACADMDYGPGSRMILDAILLALVEIFATEQRLVAILPEMRITQGDGIQISHPVSGYELWLSGNADYAVVECEDEMDYKDRLLSPGGSREDAFEISKGHLFLVVRQTETDFRKAGTQCLDEEIKQAVPTYFVDFSSAIA